MIKEEAQKVLKIEAESILHLMEKIDDNFIMMIEHICASRGRLIIAGIGKSGIIGKKMVATLNSTGTQAIFLHPVEAMHGDLGLVSSKDILIALSNSGETDELNLLIPVIKELGCTIIAFTGNPQSSLGRQSDIIIDIGVEKEACALGLAPTASSTALLAMGDAMAVVLSKKKKFSKSTYRKLHPGGGLGQRLASDVEDLMLKGEKIPLIFLGDSMENAIKEIDQKQLGTTLVINHENHLVGIITDGDLRRLIAGKQDPSQLAVEEVMIKTPKHVNANTPTYDALNVMEQHQITVLPVTDHSGKIIGIIHLHDILGKGQFKINSH